MAETPRDDAPARATAAAAEFLGALGLDVTSERLRRTPERFAAALADLVDRPPLPEIAHLPSEDFHDLVLVRDIPFQALCEHHLFPFRGVAHVGYLPADRIVGLSTLARVVEHFAHGLQMQERLTAQVADWLQQELQPRGLGVVIEAEHLCMSLRGVGTPATRTTTRAFRGELTSFEENPS
jgi:GTP cyclohydrolase I